MDVVHHYWSASQLDVHLKYLINLTSFQFTSNKVENKQQKSHEQFYRYQVTVKTVNSCGYRLS